MDWLVQALRVLRSIRDLREINTARAEVVVRERKSNSRQAPIIPPIGPARAPAPVLPAAPAAPAAPARAVGRSVDGVPSAAAARGRRSSSSDRSSERSSDRSSDRITDRDSPIQQIPLESIDPHALEVTRRLRRFGHRAYLVGGCVRDLLLGLKPKDFDVATSARPEEVKAIFRNSRIIGRRFRLVHVFFRGGKIIETSTFRANASNPEEENEDGEQDLLIRRDNVFGTEEEDALRRDFTINGLFYDTGSGRIIDHVGGLEDVEKRLLRMIGDPEIRLREDPVRILRAIRFAAKANLKIDPELLRALMRHKQDISRCAPARVLEETLRLLRIGHAEKTVRMMEETGVLEFLMPELFGYLDWPRDQEEDPPPPVNGDPARERPPRLFPGKTARDLFYAHLRALDRMIAHQPVSDAVVLGALLYAPIVDLQVEAERENRDKTRATSEFLVTIGARLMLTRRLSEHLRQIFVAQRHFGRGTSSDQKRRRKPSPAVIAKRSFFPDALALYEVHATAMDLPTDELDPWRTGGAGRVASEDDEGGDDATGPRRGRRRRGSRKRRPQGAEAE